MTTIIDVDAHFEPGGDWLAPYPKLAAKLPKLDPALLAVDAIVGDLLRDVPAAQRPPVAELLPPGLLTLFGNEKLAEAQRRQEFEGKAQFQVANAQARIKWLDQQGIAIRTGHHCAQPVMDRFGVPATARASLGVYNTLKDLDALAAGLRRVAEVFGR